MIHSTTFQDELILLEVLHGIMLYDRMLCVKDNLNPMWDEAAIELSLLCGRDRDHPIPSFSYVCSCDTSDGGDRAFVTG